MDTQTQIQRLIELAIVQRSELKQLVAELPQLREHLNAEIERVFEETEPQLRVELEEFVAKQAQDRSDAISFEVQEKIKALAQTLQDSAQAKFSALMAERERNVELTKQAEAKIAEAASALPSQVKEIVAAELARFPRAGEIDQLRKEFAEPKGLNPRGKWSGSETYNRLDLVSYNGDSYVSNTDGNREKPSRTSSAWTLNAARGMGGGGGGVTSLTDLVPVPSNGQVMIGNGSAFVNNTLTAGTGVTITNGPGTITIDATGAQEILTATVKNADSVTITKGQVVYLFGATGNMASVKLAYNTSDATSAKTFGVVASTSIAPNGTGTVTCVGVLDGLTLGSFNEGDTVYLGATPGSITATKPYAPNHLVYVGIVERANNGNGELYVKIQNGYELDEIHDVQITTPPPAGALLMRDATNSLWKANRLTAGTNIAITNADTAVTVGLTGTVAVANGGTGVTSSTGTGSVVLSNTPTLTTPVLGAATGTSLSLTGNITSPDHIFGTSGPSAKSSIAARAARQGLVFDGTANATVSVAAFASTDFSVFTWINVTSFSAARSIIGGGTGAFVFSVNTSGALVVGKYGSADLAVSTTTLTAGKWTLVGYVRSGTTGTYYIDGIAAGTTSDSYNYTAVDSQIGANGGGASIFLGTIDPVYPYNRALTAAEVVSLYESGVPAGSDYNTASNTSIITGDNSTFASDTGYWTKSSATIGSGVCTLSAGGYIYKSSFYSGVGRRYRLVVTINSIVSGNLQVNIGNSAVNITGATAPGTYTFEYAVESPGTAPLAIAATTGQIVIDNVLVYPLGLLLAPDAGQAGGGLTWYDTSGNAANITLPATGVSWNVPSSQKTASGWTYGGNLATSGNLTVSGGTTTLADSNGTFGTLTGSYNAGNQFVRLNRVGNTEYVGMFADNTIRFATNSAEAARFVSTGNLLLGTTTDSGNGRIQLASHTTSAGGIGFGTDVSLYRSSAGFLTLDNIGGTTPALALATGGTARGYLQSSGNNIYLDSATAGANLYFRSGAQTLALTLSGSDQNATFAGDVTVPNSKAIKFSAVGNKLSYFAGSTYYDSDAGHVFRGAASATALTVNASSVTIASGVAIQLGNTYVGGAPTATGYVTIKDSAGNTYKVLVGT